MKVHILATVRKPELLDAATLVFKTLRVGFPKSKIMVWGNCLNRHHREVIQQLCVANRCGFSNFNPETAHDSWIESIINTESEPVWICDTDVVFWKPIEDCILRYQDGVIMAGRYEPVFEEVFTRTIKVDRLHTAVMYLDPPKIRMAMRIWLGKFPGPWGSTAQFPLIRQTFIPRLGCKTEFYDSTAGLYQIGIGTPFTESENECFEHLHAATYVDKVAEECDLGKEMQQVHRQIYSDHTLAKGLRQVQDQYLLSKHT